MMWIIVALALVIGGVSAYVTKKDDGPIEQIAEAVIDRELGLPPGTVDITPNSK
jgi:ABC-type sulfate transport system permease component